MRFDEGNLNILKKKFYVESENFERMNFKSFGIYNIVNAFSCNITTLEQGVKSRIFKGDTAGN